LSFDAYFLEKAQVLQRFEVYGNIFAWDILKQLFMSAAEAGFRACAHARNDDRWEADRRWLESKPAWAAFWALGKGFYVGRSGLSHFWRWFKTAGHVDLNKSDGGNGGIGYHRQYFIGTFQRMVKGGHIRHLHIVLWRAAPDEVVSEIDQNTLEAVFGSEVLAGRDNSNRNRGNKPVGTDGCINDAVLGLQDWDNKTAAELVESQSWTQVQELMTCCDPLEFEALEEQWEQQLAAARLFKMYTKELDRQQRVQQWEQRCQQAQQQQRQERQQRVQQWEQRCQQAQQQQRQERERKQQTRKQQTREQREQIASREQQRILTAAGAARRDPAAEQRVEQERRQRPEQMAWEQQQRTN
jgi:hypothetical protein